MWKTSWKVGKTLAFGGFKHFTAIVSVENFSGWIENRKVLTIPYVFDDVLDRFFVV